MSRVWIITLLCAVSCGRADPERKRASLPSDPCAFVKSSSAIAVLGAGAVRQFDPEVCEWRVEFPDHSRSWLRFEARASDAPLIIVTRNEITYQGKPVGSPDPPITERLSIGDGGGLEASDSSGVRIRWTRNGLHAELQLDAGGPSAPPPMTKIEAMKALAREIDAALGARR